MVNKSMEQLIEDSRKIKGNQDNLLDENAKEESPTVSQSGRMDSEIADLADLIFTTIDEHLEVCEYRIVFQYYLTNFCSSYF